MGNFNSQERFLSGAMPEEGRMYDEHHRDVIIAWMGVKALERRYQGCEKQHGRAIRNVEQTSSERVSDRQKRRLHWLHFLPNNKKVLNLSKTAEKQKKSGPFGDCDDSLLLN